MMNMTIIKTCLKIKGMGCEKCSSKISEALNKLSGMKSAIVTLETNTALLEYNSDELEMPTLLHTIEHLGYSATICP